MFFKDRGMQALVITNVLGNVIRLLSNLLIAHFLSPEAFAITGLATTVIFAFNMISDGGFRAFILKHQHGDEAEVLNTLWTIKFIRNVFLIVLMFSFSGVIADFFEVQELSLVLQVLCLVFLFDGLMPIGFIAIERQNKIATVMYIRFAATLLSILLMVVAVYYVRNYWPIVFSMVLNQVFQVAFAYFFVGKAGTAFGVDKDIFKEFMGWVRYIIPSSIITLVLAQFDKVVLGKSLTTEELGLYFVAFNFSAAAATFTIEYARGVLQPYLSIVYRENPEQYLQTYYAKKQKICVLLAFLIGGLSGASFLFFDVLYDERYLEAGYYLAILLVTPVMTLVTYSSEVTLILYGRLKATVEVNVIRMVWFLGGAWVGVYFFGVPGLLVVIALQEFWPAVYMAIRLKMFNAISIHKELLILASGVVGFVLGRFGSEVIMRGGL